MLDLTIDDIVKLHSLRIVSDDTTAGIWPPRWDHKCEKSCLAWWHASESGEADARASHGLACDGECAPWVRSTEGVEGLEEIASSAGGDVNVKVAASAIVEAALNGKIGANGDEAGGGGRVGGATSVGEAVVIGKVFVVGELRGGRGVSERLQGVAWGVCNRFFSGSDGRSDRWTGLRSRHRTCGGGGGCGSSGSRSGRSRFVNCYRRCDGGCGPICCRNSGHSYCGRLRCTAVGANIIAELWILD